MILALAADIGRLSEENARFLRTEPRLLRMPTFPARA